MPVLCVRVPERLYDRLRSIARAQGVSVSEVVRDLLVHAVYEVNAGQLEELAKRVKSLEAEIASLRSRVTRLEELVMVRGGDRGER